MFERYTEKARRVVFFARYEASQFGAEAIEPEHILLGLLREDKGLTDRFFPRRQDSIDSIRKEIERRVGVKPAIPTSVDLPLSTIAKRVLSHAQEESEQLQHRYIGTEHLLLGLLREERSVAAEVLYECGLRLNQIREEIARASALPPPSDEPFDDADAEPELAAPLDAYGARLISETLTATAFGSLAESAREALFLARVEAGAFGAVEVSPDCVALGVLQTGEPVLPDVLPEADPIAAYETINARVEERSERRPPKPIPTPLPFSPAVWRVIAYAHEEASRAGIEVTTGCLFAGLLREGGSVASEYFAESGVTLEAARDALESDDGESV